MKKILAILLALVMVFALVACNSNTSSTSPSTSSSPSAPPATENKPPETLPPEAEPVPSGEDTIGFVTDNIDHWARDAYDIVYYNYNVTNLTAQTTDALNLLGAKYNFTVEQLTANGDADAYINNLQTILLKGPDGLLVDISQELAPRVSEILDEYGIPAVCLFNKAVDVDGVELIPSVIMDQFYNGERQLEHLNSVYKDYWGDIDRAEIALLILDWSTNMDINMRAQGAESKWKELFGDQTFYYGDTAAESLSAEAGYNVANSLLAAHPEVKYWFVVGTVEDITLGAGRAIEALGKQDNVLMTASGAAILPGEWDAGYDGCWIANYAVSPFLYSGTGTFGLLAMIDGRATKETLWPDQFLPGDKAPRFMLKANMMTRENYKNYLGDIVKSFGVEYAG